MTGRRLGFAGHTSFVTNIVCIHILSWLLTIWTDKFREGNLQPQSYSDWSFDLHFLHAHLYFFQPYFVSPVWGGERYSVLKNEGATTLVSSATRIITLFIRRGDDLWIGLI